ncbi:nuclease domain-containing protein [Variovorax sp. RCC_210]|uniref:nuclease domain-containing protein n=1 Tax=Variovorax sp. RCC_210 TaxID=3239217 RepID=UPI003526BA7D
MRTEFKRRRPEVIGVGLASGPDVTVIAKVLPVSGRIVSMVAINDADFRGAMPKTVKQENRTLLDMAKGQRCLLQVPDTCTGDTATTVACHSNWSVHGKAGARKADDQWSVWGCVRCHRWLDQGPAPAAEKVERFAAAHRWMVAIWQDIVAGMQPATPRERRAAEWALARVRPIV